MCSISEEDRSTERPVFDQGLHGVKVSLPLAPFLALIGEIANEQYLEVPIEPCVPLDDAAFRSGHSHCQ